MSIRTLRTVAVLLLLCATLTVPFAAAEQTIKLATLIPEGSFWDRALRDMGAAWEQITGGDVRLRIYSGGVAGDDPDMIRKLRIGQLQAATVTVSGLTEIDPAFALFELPAFFASHDELTYVLRELRPELERRLAENGFQLLHWVHGGWIYFFTSEPIASLDEFQQLRMFVWAGNDEMSNLWRKHGFRPVPLAATDILTGLETGLFGALPSAPIAAPPCSGFAPRPT